MDKKAMRYEIAKEVFPLAIETAQMVLRHGKALEGCKTMQQGAAQLAVMYADALIEKLEKTNSKEIYPLTVIADRYDGCYSGGSFTAWPLDYFQIPDGPDGCDPECQSFWDSYEYPVGKGSTAQEAIDDLLPKMESFKEETREMFKIKK